MRTRTLLLVGLFVGFMFTGCGPTAVEQRAQQVAEAKDDALKLRQQLAQAKSGAEAENLRQQLIKRLNDVGLPLESIHFTEAELNEYVKSASAAVAQATEAKAAKATKAVRQLKGHPGKKKGS